MSSAIVLDRPIGGVFSLTGTANQVTVSAATGAVTLSLPQSIATTSTPTFAGLTLNGNLVMDVNSITMFGASLVASIAGQPTWTTSVGTHHYFTIKSSATNRDAAYQSNDGTFSTFAGLLGGSGAGTTGSWAVYTDDIRLKVSRNGETTIPGKTNFTPLTISGYSLTGSSAVSLTSLTGTLNTSGNPDVWLLDLTNTASGATTKAMNVKVGGSSMFSVDMVGAVIQASTLTIGSTLAVSLSGANNRVQIGTGAVPAKVGIATNSVAAAAAEDGGVMIATTDNTLIYYSGGSRFKVVGVTF